MMPHLAKLLMISGWIAIFAASSTQWQADARRPGQTLSPRVTVPVRHQAPLAFTVMHDPFAPLDVPDDHPHPVVTPPHADRTPVASGSLVLCAALTGTTPQAVFLANDDTAYGTIGTTIAGYTIANIAIDRVTFTSGETLEQSDCTQGPNDAASASPPLVPNPSAPAGAPELAPPSSTPASGHTVPTAPEPSPTSAIYGTETESANDVYGAPAPSTNGTSPYARPYPTRTP